MVVMKMKVKCPLCQKEVNVKNESGEFNGEVAKFECDHYSGSIILETKIGWLLGTNAETKYHLHIRCLRCNEENIVSILASGLSNKSDYKVVQFCHSPHFLNIEYEQDSMVSGAVNVVNSIKGLFG